MDLSTIANVATALTVLTGVAFGLIEMRRARKEREERAAFAAVQALMTPEWMSSSMIVASIPEGTTAAELENNQRALEAALIRVQITAPQRAESNCGSSAPSDPRICCMKEGANRCLRFWVGSASSASS